MKRLFCGVIALASLALLLNGAASHPFAPYWPAVMALAWLWSCGCALHGG